MCKPSRPGDDVTSPAGCKRDLQDRAARLEMHHLLLLKDTTLQSNHSKACSICICIFFPGVTSIHHPQFNDLVFWSITSLYTTTHILSQATQDPTPSQCPPVPPSPSLLLFLPFTIFPPCKPQAEERKTITHSPPPATTITTVVCEQM